MSRKIALLIVILGLLIATYQVWAWNAERQRRYRNKIVDWTNEMSTIHEVYDRGYFTVGGDDVPLTDEQIDSLKAEYNQRCDSVKHYAADSLAPAP